MPRSVSRRRLPAPAVTPVSRRSLAQRQFRQSPWIVRKPGAMRFAVPATLTRTAR